MRTPLSLRVPAGPADETGVRKFTKAGPLAARLGLSKKTLFRWADAGHVSRFKLNERVVLFDEAQVAAFIESARVEGQT